MPACTIRNAAFLIALSAAACSSPEERGELAGKSETPKQVDSVETPAPVATSETQTPIVAPSDAGKIEDSKPFDMRTWQPHAKGLWIWHFDYVGMTPAQAATKAKGLGVAYVLIKSGQDGTFWTQRFNASIVNEFTSRGIRVLAWPYITPSGGQAAIDAAVEAAKVPGCDGLVLDVEIEWEKAANKVSAAQALCEGIRQKKPGVWLGYTSFGWVGYHTTFPFKTFDQYCGDAAFPQIYFADRGVAWDGPKGLSEALAQYQAAGLKAPLWPLTSNDDVYGTSAGPTTAALNGFFAAAGPLTTLWTFPDKARSEKLTQLDQLAWPNP